VRWLALSAVALVSVVLGAHAGGGAADAQPSTLPTIAETLPTLSIDDVTTHETNVDTDAVLTVTLTPASSETVTVHWGTGAGTADSADYVTASGTLTFPPGATSLRFPVEIKGDALDEPDETFSVDLFDADHATIARGTGTVTIVDDDPARLRVLDAAVDARWRVHRTYTRVARLVVARAPVGATVEIRCSGSGCPFKDLPATLSLTRMFAGAKLRPGTTVTVLVDAPGMIGRVFQYRIRTARAPLRKLLCLPPAAAKPAPC